ncbi:hypothetical protein [Caulobacter sp. 17J65-9]|uniref:hypothetical protein n=1 Tax=Caulobacter sp. 17J65-9 TaxID=2709382 RepID=UPI0013CC3A07|nr:hypothetical protein [Caulobacter sp. 17J65-9]NEX94231.1 hypothetical protein [Caulobacter sp. 17J65-9]
MSPASALVAAVALLAAGSAHLKPLSRAEIARRVAGTVVTYPAIPQDPREVVVTSAPGERFCAKGVYLWWGDRVPLRQGTYEVRHGELCVHRLDETFCRYLFKDDAGRVLMSRTRDGANPVQVEFKAAGC